jgi:hypothetical protein
MEQRDETRKDLCSILAKLTRQTTLSTRFRSLAVPEPLQEPSRPAGAAWEVAGVAPSKRRADIR